MVRREVLREVGLLNEDLFLYCEEDDWCLRIGQAGWEVFYLPGVQVVHLGRASVDLTADQMFLQLYKSKVAYFRKHHGSLRTFLLKCILYFGHWPRLAFAGVAYAASSWRRAAHAARFKRCWRLLLELPHY
jgi:GT2 family glycosyltransferase